MLPQGSAVLLSSVGLCTCPMAKTQRLQVCMISVSEALSHYCLLSGNFNPPAEFLGEVTQVGSQWCVRQRVRVGQLSAG